MVREPIVAGTFYPANAETLKRQIEECFLSSLGPRELPKVSPKDKGEIIGLISPHAGYIYSGPVASHGLYVLAQDQEPSLVIVLGPNHTGVGPRVSLQLEGSWRTPLGNVDIDSAMADSIISQSKHIRADNSAHALEHSIEVQIPFLQYVFGSSFKIVPICFLDQSLEVCQDVGEALYQALVENTAVIIASTDFTHYESQEQATSKDEKAIKTIQNLDAEGLLQTVREYSISMCGSGPVAATLIATKKLGASECNLLSYHTSGDVIGDYTSVVGYASLSIKK